MRFSQLARMNVFSGTLQKASINKINLLFFTRKTTNDEEVVEVFVQEGNGKWRPADKEDVITLDSVQDMDIKDIMTVWALFGDAGMKLILELDPIEGEAKALSRQTVMKWKREMEEILFEKVALRSLKGPVSLCLTSTTFERYLNEKDWRYDNTRMTEITEQTAWREVANVFGETFRFKRSRQSGKMERVVVRNSDPTEWRSTPNGCHYDLLTSLEMFQQSGKIKMKSREIKWVFNLFGGNGMHVLQLVLTQLLQPNEWQNYGIEFEEAISEENVNLPDEIFEFQTRCQVQRYAQQTQLSESKKRLLMGFQRWTREENKKSRK